MIPATSDTQLPRHAMKLTLGVAAGIVLTILVHIIWNPALGWAFSRGDS